MPVLIIVWILCGIIAAIVFLRTMPGGPDASDSFPAFCVFLMGPIGLVMTLAIIR